MMDCIYGFASSISKDLVCGVVDELTYPCCFNNLVDVLQNEENRLVETRECVQERVDHAKRQTKKTAGLVHKWLNQANALTNNVEELLKQARTNKSCCSGQCPNWIWRYRLGKQLAKNKGVIEKCIEEGSRYTQLERLVSLPGLAYFSSDRCVRFDSRQDASDQLMKALKDDRINMIGLYGMGGCGKTTLAIEVGRKAKEESLFDEVLFVAVSGAVEVQGIQEKMASWLGYDLQEKETMRRAQRLFKILTQIEKVLVILDDVWERLDFEAIGIPSKRHKGCKVFITTRLGEVCMQNDCQKEIQLSNLTHEEAWSFFRIQAQISEDTSSNLKQLARKVSDECEGLLVALTALANTLKGKTEDEWKAALNRLGSSKLVNIGKGLPNPYICLSLSYDYLTTEERSLFLLCSVFPEDYYIPVEDLIRFAIGLGLVGEVRSFEGARSEVSAAKSKLIRSSLLLDAEGGKHVKMHDLVRDVALWIASNENKVVKCALEKDVTVDCSSIRYLWCREFPNQLDCSNIEFLCLKTDLEITDEIFKGMDRLRVLFLCWEGLQRGSLSIMSLKSLSNLRCLFLDWWDLSDISYVGYMKKLESLTLQRCSFFELPENVVDQLTNLRLLDLSECDMKRNPFDVIGRDLLAEELYIDDCRQEWDFYNESTAEFFSKFHTPKALKRYRIRLGTSFAKNQGKHLGHGKTLFLSCFDTSNTEVKYLAEKSEVLFIANIHGGAKSIIPDIFQIERGGCMNFGWTELLIRDCENIVCLVDTSNHLSAAATLSFELHKLTIERLEHLVCLCHSQHQSGIFDKLEELCIEDCPELLGSLFEWKLNLSNLKAMELDGCLKLTSIFTPAAARSAVNLEKLKVLYCDELQQVLADDDSREETSRDDHRLVFPKLKLLTVRGCKKIEYIIPVTFTQGLLQLECLELEVDNELKYVFGPCKLGGHQSPNEIRIDLPLLEKLILINLPNIISICPTNCYATWPSLYQFDLWNCPEFGIVSVNTCLADAEGRRECDHNMTKIKSNGSNIRKIRVMKGHELAGLIQVAGGSIAGEQDPLTKCLQKLSSICSTLIETMNFQNLEQMEVNGSKEISSRISGGLPLLKDSVIENRNQVDEDGEHQHFLYLHLESNAQRDDFVESAPIPSIPLVNYSSGPFHPRNLKRLVVKSCSMLTTLFSPSTARCLTSLEELMIAECQELRSIVTCESPHENNPEIIPEDHGSLCDASIMFSRLRRISVMHCKLLEYILNVCSAQGLEKMKDIEIRHTPNLRYLFGEEIHDHLHSSNQFQNKIQIKLPLLENVTLVNIPHMSKFCPDSYYVTCSSLQWLAMDNVGLSTLSANNLMIHSGSKLPGRSHSSTLDIRAERKINGQALGSVTIHNSSKIKGIFHLDGFPTNGGQVTSWLMNLDLFNLPELRYIWKGPKHLVTLQNLGLLYICRCQKLKAIFSTCVSRSLPQLKILVVLQCDELEQIIEEDEENEIVSVSQSTQVCFSKLKLLLVTQCNKLKRMFYLSKPHKFPELEYLIINQNQCLEEIFEECNQLVTERRVEVSLRELKLLVLMQLPNLNDISQGIQFNRLTNILVHNCPKVSLTATTTAEDMLLSSCDDKVIYFFVRCDLLYIRDIINEETAEKVRLLETTRQLQMNTQHQSVPGREVVSTEGNGSSSFETGSFSSETYEDLTLKRENKGTQDLESLEPKFPSIPTPNLTQSIEKIETDTAGSVPVPVKVKVTLPTLGSEPAIPLHKIPSSSTADKIKESFQEGSSPKDTTKAVMSAGPESKDSGVVAMAHTETETSQCQQMQKVDNNIEIHQHAQSDHSLIIVELGAYKHCVDLDDAQIALLAEAMAAYPHLRKVLGQFSMRFQAWMLKTLVDMLFFLRNENAASVTPQGEKAFLEQCDEAAQLGFDKSWVDQMRQRVMVKDPSMDHARAQLGELHKRHNQLTEELHQITEELHKVKDEIDNLNEFVDSHQNKCFDFL